MHYSSVPCELGSDASELPRRVQAGRALREEDRARVPSLSVCGLCIGYTYHSHCPRDFQKQVSLRLSGANPQIQHSHRGRVSDSFDPGKDNMPFLFFEAKVRTSTFATLCFIEHRDQRSRDHLQCGSLSHCSCTWAGAFITLTWEQSPPLRAAALHSPSTVPAASAQKCPTQPSASQTPEYTFSWREANPL